MTTRRGGRTGAAGLLFALLLLGAAREPEAWIFFSPDSPDASGLFAEARRLGLRVRAVMLTARYRGAREPAEAFVATLQVSGEVLVVDAEGLRLAERLGIRDLPALVLRRGKRTHVACGARVRVEELLTCSN